MPWFLALTDHQQPWYLLFQIDRSLSMMIKNANNFLLPKMNAAWQSLMMQNDLPITHKSYLQEKKF